MSSTFSVQNKTPDFDMWFGTLIIVSGTCNNKII